jgi:DNA-binding transcriptional ArsR family regulator
LPLSVTTPACRSFGCWWRAGDDGLRVGDIGQHLGIAPSTLAHHLSALVDAGLVLQEKQGREVFNRVDFPAMRRLVGFLTSECCAGVPVRHVGGCYMTARSAFFVAKETI